VPAQEQVIEGSHAGKELRVLERSGDPAHCHLIWSESEKVRPFKKDVAAIGSVDPTDAVYECGLACSVRADDRRDGSLLDGKADVLQGHHPAELKGEIFYAEEGRRVTSQGIPR
jgi:hypothetical protein